MVDLQEIEAIKRLKYRYFRCIDTKAWAELADCFSEDASCAYDAGKYSFEGRERVMEFLEGAMGRASMITFHQVPHPEIELGGDGTATGVWYLEDRVIDTDNHFVLHGAAFYRDEYVKQDDVWRIRATGYERTFEEMGDLREHPLRLTRSMFGA